MGRWFSLYLDYLFISLSLYFSRKSSNHIFSFVFVFAISFILHCVLPHHLLHEYYVLSFYIFILTVVFVTYFFAFCIWYSNSREDLRQVGCTVAWKNWVSRRRSARCAWWIDTRTPRIASTVGTAF